MEIAQKYYLHNNKLLETNLFNDNILNKGISIYEVIKIEKGIPLFLEDHLARLYHSSELSSFHINEGYCDFESLIEQLIKKNNTTEGKIKLIVQFDKSYPHSETDVLIYFTPHYFPSQNETNNVIKVGICNAIRQNPNAKVLNTQAREKANKKIIDSKLFEVLLIDNDQNITEGSRSNVFFISDNKILTPPVSDVLNGITRKNIIKLCKENNLLIAEEKININDLNKIDSAFLSGTSLKVLPINTIEEQKLNVNNPLLKTIQNLYNDLVDEYLASKLT